MCRTLFNVPTGGIRELTNDFNMNKLLQINQSNDVGDQLESDKENSCGVGSFSGNNTEATSTLCSLCSSSDHGTDKCAGVQNMTEESIEQLREDINKIATSLQLKDQTLQQIEVERGSFIERIERTEYEILQRYAVLEHSDLAGSHRSQLITELNAFKENEQKRIQCHKDETEHERVILETFLRHCQEVIDRGGRTAPGEMSPILDELHVRAEQLLKIQKECDVFKFSELDVKFISSPAVADHSTENLIGRLVYGGQVLDFRKKRVVII